MKLTKTSYLLGLQCPLRLWCTARGIPEAPPDELPYDAAEDFAEEAQRVEDLARGLLGPAAPYQVVLETETCRSVADFLIPEAGGHRLIEVKASGTPKKIHLHDLAFQWVVAEDAGQPIRAAEILHVDKSYRLGQEGIQPERLLMRLDVTEQVRELLAATREEIRRLHTALNQEAEPDAAPGPRCKGNRDSKSEVRPSDCGHMLPGARCRARLPADWAGELPRLTGAARQAVDTLPPPQRIAALDADAGPWSDEQRRCIHASQCGAEIVEQDGLDEALAPFRAEVVAYLDFEFDPFVAIPRHAGMAPFDRLPFQWSLQRSDRPQQTFDFLHDGPGDPRRAFIESLLEALPAEGPIIVYHAPAETTVLKYYLSGWFDGEYAGRVQAVLERIQDLCALVKRHYAHPDMHGSFSLKRVAPAMLGRGYDDLAISDGLAAVRIWRRLQAADLPAEDAERARQGLLAYCGRDAGLMSGMLARLASFAAVPAPRG